MIKDQLIYDIKDILKNKSEMPKEKMNVLFAVCGMENEGKDLEWTKWYLSRLKKMGYAV